LIAPQLFSQVLEYPIALVGGALLLPRGRSRARLRQAAADFAFPALLGAALLLVTLAPVLFGRWFAEDDATFMAAVLVAMAFMARPTRFGLALGAIFAVSIWIPTWSGAEMLSTRDFFGIKHVNRSPGFHSLAHGGTLHGMESTLYGHERDMLTYYSPGGPLGDIFRNLRPRLSNAHVAVTGLGVGTVACYATPGQTWTYYEIDPQVVAIATDRKYFRYLSSCTPHAKIVLGDARLSLGREAAHGDALLILDAYASDQPPLHLITKEAFEVYLAKLAPHGAIAIDISSRYFDLSPVLGNVADAENLVAFSRTDPGPPDGLASGVTSSHWVVIARDAADLGTIPSDRRWQRVAMDRSIRLWTDDYSSLIRVWKQV
jgi:hypothetical protein